MRLEGIHHVTAITADATENLAFYGGVLGLRLVKKTVNFDDPTAYHLYYGDETGAPGSIMTFFEYPGAPPGRAGDGMIHRVVWRVRDAAALDFWAARLAAHGIEARRDGDALAFEDPEGLGIDLVVDRTDERGLPAASADIPAEHALLGIEGVRARSSRPEASAPFIAASIGSVPDGDVYAVAGEARTATYALEPSAPAPGRPSAGTIHHVAWCARDEEELVAWQRRAGEAGGRVSPVMDRTYFRSIYFREPSGVLFEIATAGPGFAFDEEPEHLGEALRLPPQHEHLRSKLEQLLRPLANPRAVSA